MTHVAIIADVQWADVEDGFSFDGKQRRCFRGSLKVLAEAVDWWCSLDEAHRPSFVAQLGDLIDGRNKQSGTSHAALQAALAHLSRMPCRVVNLVGNHELMNFGREALGPLLNTRPAPNSRENYSFLTAPGWRVCVCDAYREGVIGYASADEPNYVRAVRTLQENNPNDLSKGGDFFVGLSGTAQRFVPYNGALGAEQIRWLRSELMKATMAGERVVLLSHVIFHPTACDGRTMLWDYPEALDAISTTRCVAAILCGHDHQGGYTCDAAGVHHLTFCSPLNKGADGCAFGLLGLHEVIDRRLQRGSNSRSYHQAACRHTRGIYICCACLARVLHCCAHACSD